MQEMLVSMSFDADAVSSGEEAVAAVGREDSRGHGYDLVVMDWHMPGINGIDACRKISALALAKPPQLLLVTAYGREEVFHQAKDAGIRDVLLKPLSPSMLFDAAIRILQSDQSDDGPVFAENSTPQALEAIAGARILVVEDNPVNQEVMLALLSGTHFVPELAENGRIALTMLETYDYDLVLMDMQMPVMGGVEATREIMRLPRPIKPPIVAMTANAMLSDRDACLDAGMCDFLTKPVEPDRLWQVLVKWIPPRPQHFHVAKTASAEIPVAAGPVFNPGVPGIDAATALRRMMGNQRLYIDTLRLFCRQQDGIADAVRRALDAGDGDGARHLAHTLKGAAGTIGAAELFKQAAALEAEIGAHQARSRLDPAIEILESNLGQLIAALRTRLPPEAETSLAAQPIALDEFEQLLVTSDPEALAWFLAHGQALLDILSTEECDQIEAAVRNFDLQEAREFLTKARAREVTP
jgi:two-component system sensor histidine kinase/response regulator